MVIMAQSGSATPLENEAHQRDHDTDSRGSQTDSGNELSVGGSSSEGDSMSQHHAMNQSPDQAPSSQPNGLLGPVPNNPSFTVLPTFGTEFSPKHMFAQNGSLFDTPPSVIQSPHQQQFEMFTPTSFPAFAGKLPFRCVQCNQTAHNGVLQFLCAHKTCATCLQNSSMSSDMRNGCQVCGSAPVFNTVLHCPSPNGSLLLDSSSPIQRVTPQGSRPFSFSLSGLPVSPAPSQNFSSRLSTPNSVGFQMRPQLTLNDVESLSSPSMWSPLVPPPLALKNISNLTPVSPMVHSAFESLTAADDNPVFSPLSPTNTSIMIPTPAIATSETAVVPVAIAPPRSSVSSIRTPSVNAPPPVISIPPVQPNNVDGMPFNPFPGTQCQGCESHPSFAFCIQCNESLCSHCVDAHQRVRATKQHRVVGLNLIFAHLMQQQQQLHRQQQQMMQEDVFHGQQQRRVNGSSGSAGDGQTSFGENESLSGDSSPRSSSVCSVHESKIVGFCDHCPQTVALCAICVAQHPNKHRVQPIGDLRLAITELANESCLLDWQCEKTNEAIGRIANTVMVNAAVAEKEVKTSIDAHINAMEERKAELLKRVETVKQLKLSVLFAQAEMLKNKQSDLKQAVQNASALIESGNVDESQLRQTFEQLAACQSVGLGNGTSPNGTNGTPPATTAEPNNNLMNVLMLACQVNEDDRLKFNAPQDGSLMNKVRQFGNIESGPCAKTSTIVGDGYKKSIRERQSVINVQLRDACGDILSSSIAATQPVLQPLLPHQVTPPHSHLEQQFAPSADVQAIVLGPDGTPVESTITPRENGLVVISYFPSAEGTYVLNVLVKGTPISGCPANVDVRRGRNYDEIAAKGPVFSFGREGSGDGELCRPWGICIDLRGRVLVADRSNNRVQIFDKDGNFLSKFGTSGNRPGQFDRPAGLTTNNLNHIIVADKDNHRVQVFDENGTFLLKFGDRGRAVGYFNYPWGVATNSHNAIAVSDTRNHRVQIFTPQGQFVRKCGFDSAYFFKNLDSPRGLCYLPDGQLLITDFNNHRLAVLSPRNMSEMKVYGSEGDADGMFVRPQGVKIDSEGHILVCDSRNNRIQVFASEDMRFIGSFGLGPATNGFQMPTELPAPYSTLTGPFGAPAFSSTPTPLTPSPRQLLDRPTDLAVGPDGRIYVVDFGNNCIRVF